MLLLATAAAAAVDCGARGELRSEHYGRGAMQRSAAGRQSSVGQASERAHVLVSPRSVLQPFPAKSVCACVGISALCGRDARVSGGERLRGERCLWLLVPPRTHSLMPNTVLPSASERRCQLARVAVQAAAPQTRARRKKNRRCEAMRACGITERVLARSTHTHRAR